MEAQTCPFSPEKSDPSKVDGKENSLSSQESTNHYDKVVPPPEDVVPLSGSPFFSVILSKSNTQSPYQLVIPRNFYSQLPVATVPVTLSCRNKIWELNYYGDRSLRRFDSGWKNFAVDNNLKMGDACIFELLDNKEELKFKLQILGGSIPPVQTEDSKGTVSDAPIIID